ncbi:MAG: thioredoxin family protein [Dysgonamonadaceae bacterium]|jgi:hypothetical protein|nr:thioredoxin family protein [Dysgonamonadaceae bacterium]
MRYLKRISFLAFTAIFLMGAATKETGITKGIQPGNLAPELNLQGLNLINGKDYVLLQFWAAYDGTSRAMNTQMHNVIAHLGTDNIRLASVSMDESSAVYEGIVKADGLNPATQFNEPAGKHAAIFKAYRLNSGFGNWLINPEGIIIAKDVHPKEIAGYISD